MVVQGFFSVHFAEVESKETNDYTFVYIGKQTHTLSSVYYLTIIFSSQCRSKLLVFNT